MLIPPVDSTICIPGVVQIESIFYDLPYGLMPNKSRSLQTSFPVIVMEDLQGGDLLHRIDARARANKPISEKFLAATFKSAMVALDSIHKRHYIHRDIKLANMLLMSEAEDSPVKLIDFGSLAQLDRATQKVVCNEAYGTLRFMAPETLRPLNKEYSIASDIWQCGCVLYYMLCADAPFHTPAEIKAGVFETDNTPVPLSAEAKDLLAGMLAVNPASRLSMEAILTHPWLGGGASDAEFSEDYSLRVKNLHICRKLQDIFQPRSRSRTGSLSSNLPRSRSASYETLNSASITTTSDTNSGILLDSVSSKMGLVGNNIGSESRKGGYVAGASDLIGGFVDNLSRVCGWTGIDIDAEARYYFNRIDSDKDGWINQEDLQAGVKLLIVESNSHHLQCYPSADRNGGANDYTGSVNVRLGPNVLTNIEEIFNVIDYDHIHRADFNKFRAFYAQVFMPSSKSSRWR